MAVDLIERAFAWEALDSRGTPTVACAVVLESGAEGEATVPSGASTGTHEAHERRDGGERYGGKGVRDAVAHVPRRDRARARRPRRQRPARRSTPRCAQLDGTPSLERLGANAVLAASVACARRGRGLARPAALARARRRTAPPLLPLPMVNVISGGAHAGGLVDVQDFLVVPVGARTFAEAIEWAARVRAATAERAPRARATVASLVADEGGLAARAAVEPRGARAARRGRSSGAGSPPAAEVAIAIDVAATQLLGDGPLRARERGPQRRAPAELVDELAGWVDAYPIVSIEDVARRGRRRGLAATRRPARQRVQLLGDDLFVTSPERLSAGIADGVANAVLVKPNQIGTLTRRAPGRRHRAARPATPPCSRPAPARPRTAGSPTSPSAGAPARSRSARRRAPSAPPSGTGCCESRPRPTAPSSRASPPCDERARAAQRRGPPARVRSPAALAGRGGRRVRAADSGRRRPPRRLHGALLRACARGGSGVGGGMGARRGPGARRECRSE